MKYRRLCSQCVYRCVDSVPNHTWSEEFVPCHISQCIDILYVGVLIGIDCNEPLSVQDNSW